MIRIMQVLTDTNVGGAGIWLLNYLKTYCRERFEMVVVLPAGSALIPMAEETGVRVVTAEKIADQSFSVPGIRELREIMIREEPDVVHTHASLSARIAARLEKIPVVNTRHCLEPPKRHVKRFVYQFLNNALSDRVIAVSEAVMENLLQDGIKADKLRIVYNGITPLREYSLQERRLLRQEHNIPDTATVVGIVARLEPVKNHAMFLEAAKFIATACPDTLFMIVGDGSLRTELEKQAEPLGERVLFTGYLPDVTDAVNMMDILTLTSEHEALSISLIEGMSIGKPAVATKSGGPSEVIEQGISGILVDPNDAVAFSMAVIRLIQNPLAQKQFGDYGRKIVKEKFMASEMAKKVEKIYDELAEDVGEATEGESR